MSSSSLSSIPPSSPPDTELIPDRLTTSVRMADHLDNLEHNVARYAILLFIKFFSLEIWNMVPQYYTYAGKWPDLILEIFVRRPGRRRGYIFVPRVFVEFKAAINEQDAIKQLIASISEEYGPRLKSKGFLIGVKGTQWTILDYHIVLTQGNTYPECFILNFYNNMGANGVQAGLPRPLRQYENYDFMDLRSPDDTTDLCQALRWIGENNESRDLTFTRHHARPLPVSLTVSTLRSLSAQNEDQYIVELGEEFAHLIPLFRGDFSRLVETMDTDD